MSIKIGFYDDLDLFKKDYKDATFYFLDNIEVTDENNAYKYLHGRCDEFAAMLSEIYGYEIEAVRNADGRLIHAYCVSQIGGQKAYIDVRGITIDPVQFYEEFKNELNFYAPTRQILVEDEEGYEVDAGFEIWMNKDELFEGEYEGWKDDKLCDFIKDYTDYYDVSKYIGIYQCKCCGERIYEDKEEQNWIFALGEESLWGHIQLAHPEVFEECRNLETPDMLEMYYDFIIEKESNRMKRLDLNQNKFENKHRSLDAIISAARKTFNSRKGHGDDGPGSPANEMELPKKLPDAISR